MASGSWNNDGISPADFNPYVKVYNYGWTEAKSLTKDAINTIGISSEKGNIYRINSGILSPQPVWNSNSPGCNNTLSNA